MGKMKLLIILPIIANMLLLAGNIFAADQTESHETLQLTIIAGAIFLTLIFFVIITNIKFRNFKKEIQKQSLTDKESGIANRLHFEKSFENIISDFSRELYYIAYLIVDVNYLEVYQSELSIGDVIKYTAKTLSDSAEYGEFAARITENGFAFAFKSTDAKTAENKLNAILEKLNKYADPKQNSNTPIFHASYYNLGKDDKSCDLILFNLRRYCIKISGTEKQTILCDVHNIHSVKEEKEIIDSIINGIENSEFKLHLQFIVDNKSKNIISAEGLSRWVHPQKGILTPGHYIDNMNRIGIISKHDYYMFEEVCKQLQTWSSTPLAYLSISCNFTRITISEDDFITKIQSILNKYAFDRSRLVIEITEDAIEKNLKKAMYNISKCKELGLRLALDDLGSGYTSLSNLCDYPFDIVKIDRDILLKAEKNRGSALFDGIIALAHSLNLKVICEGVETKEQYDFVSDSECDGVQGWYFSMGTPVEDAEIFIEKYKNSLK